MSGPLRFRFASALILAALSTSPAFANPFEALFNRAPEEPPAPAPANDSDNEECLSQPGKPADGQHWVYRLDGHRRCWFLVPEGTATLRQRVHHRAAKRRLAARQENEAAPRKRKAVVDARAELLRAAPPETLQPTPVPALRVVDAAPVPAAGAAALVPPPPVLTKPDQLTADQPDPRQDNVKDNVEALLAATPANSDSIAVSTSTVTPVAVPVAGAGEDGRWWTASWLGPLLMALGLLLLLAMPLRRAVLVARNLWAQEGEGRLALIRSDDDSQPGPSYPGQVQARPRASRPAIADRSKSATSGQGNRDISFQEAIKVLTDFDIITVEPGPATLSPRRLESAPARRTRTKASRMS